jgi:hypothetical protein
MEGWVDGGHMVMDAIMAGCEWTRRAGGAVCVVGGGAV